MLKKFLITLSLISLSFQSFAAFEDKPQNPYKNWVLIGDSAMSVVGFDSFKGQYGSPKLTAPNLVMQERNVNIINLSGNNPLMSLSSTDINGYGNSLTTIQNIKRLGNIHGIIIQAGGNDYVKSATLSNFSKSLESILAYSLEMNKKVIIIEPTYRSREDVKNSLGLTLNNYRNQMKISCDKYKTVCNFLPVNELKNYATAYQYIDSYDNEFSKAFHLNSKGHRLLANKIIYFAAVKGLF